MIWLNLTNQEENKVDFDKKGKVHNILEITLSYSFEKFNIGDNVWRIYTDGSKTDTGVLFAYVA